MPVQISPRAHEKELAKNLLNSYLELAQVPLDEKSKTFRENFLKGIRQISFVPSEEGMPASRAQHGEGGRSDKGTPTVYQKHKSQQASNGEYCG